MSDELGYVRLDNAKVQAFKYPIVDFPVGFRGGPAPEGEALQRFRHFRGGNPYDHFEEGAQYPAKLSGDYIYAGPLFDHFGHFLSEMVHRIVPAHTRGMKFPFLFATSDVNGTALDMSEIAPFVRDILSYLGVSVENAVVINKNTVVERLHLFEQGARLAGPAKRSYLDELRTFSSARLDSLFPDVARPRKLYVSRSALPRIGALMGEKHLESALQSDGYTIYRPELDPFAVQMDHYRKADVVIFAEGSAIHGTELLGTDMLNHAALIPRSQQSHVLENVLVRRSRKFTRLPVSRYAGTIKRNPTNGAPLFHRGAALLRPVRVKKEFRRSELSGLPGFSVASYWRAAAEDLRLYLREATPTPEPFSLRYAAKMAFNVPFGSFFMDDIERRYRS